MSFRLPAAFLVISLLVFSSCCSSNTGAGGRKLKDENKQQEVQNRQSADTLYKQTSPGGAGPTAIRENSSVITGQIVDKKNLGENDFELTVLVKASEGMDNESIIVKGMVYQMKPSFVEENGKILPLERNKKLLELKNLPKGSTFRARASFTGSNRCIIQEVLEK